ncbi:hypothetical protein ELQ35_11350 [Peribacillus cavernae]|uniref:FMN-dependent dehydrogenase domain-containing protein n=1 Tax=Peribacillus cavernae TaxID=1674310 RepID=A0A3S0TVJ4_9BACI|nr:alpha-hydroxy-acid oxidizing protein [Peribacillus cavernae]MDQ0220213.1 isopentenyl diphosphate isomerase/L-lactate dehydrogenase-like FMN-dependent dehydrogenase [Peribacillus cavernae]RUQ28832.1 hypothetical protein ELQ35_11350 [Peribacillus cavernae]
MGIRSDREIAASMVKRAETAGYRTIVITLDTPMMSWRERRISNSCASLLCFEKLFLRLEVT